MKIPSPFSGLSLLWRILISTSLAIVLLFAVTAFVVQKYALLAAENSLENEERISSQVYRSLWTERTEKLAAVCRIIASMSDVRAAFLTRDQGTIRDSAQELWSRAAQKDTIFLVLSPTGSQIAALSIQTAPPVIAAATLAAARRKFPSQVSGYLSQGEHLFYVVLTPVYVQAGASEALLSVLLAGFEVNDGVAKELKSSTQGDFVFLMNSHVVASTVVLRHLKDWQVQPQQAGELRHFSAQGQEYVSLGTVLNKVEGGPVGELRVIRSLAGAQSSLHALERNVAFIWVAAALFGLMLTYLLARHILLPVQRLDRAALEVAEQHYDYRVPVESDDELGRLARTFNKMCDSIQHSREELIRHERMSTIGRLSSSIVHDLRNPLAAIYGGAEMLIDSDLPPAQSKRLASSIYRASRRIQELLQDISNVSRGRSPIVEMCRLSELIAAACELLTPVAETQGVKVTLDIPVELELPLERARVERLFVNLMSNALEAMPSGGELRVTATRDGPDALIHVDDIGPGISAQLKTKLFQPFASEGKKNGLGLGLALSRQTAIDHGGNLWLEEKAAPGARFCIRLPLGQEASAEELAEKVPSEPPSRPGLRHRQ